MKKYCNARQIEKIDRIAQEEYGIPSLVLMENAGRGATEVALKMLPKKVKRKVVCVCGKGNNGGDGFVCARHLINRGVGVEIFLVGRARELKGDAKINFNILTKMGANLKNLKNYNRFRQELKKADLVIDAIFGIGLSGSIKEPYTHIIDLINNSKRKVLSLDIPSGLDATTGRILGTCVKATKTVTFVLAKTGLVKRDGPRYSGKVNVCNISIPDRLIEEVVAGR